MRRRIGMLSVLALLGAGLGCHHVGGKCDCGAHPSDAVYMGPTNPHPSAPVGVAPAGPVIPQANPNVGKVPENLPPLKVGTDKN